MKKCDLCDKDIHEIAPLRTFEGYLCRECTESLPQSMRMEYKHYDKRQLLKLRAWVKKNEKNAKKFSETAAYGTLRIDEPHGLFAVCDRAYMKNGEFVKPCPDVFNILDLKSVNIYSEITGQSDTAAYIKTSFSCEFEKPEYAGFKAVIMPKTVCPIKDNGDGTFSCGEPGSLLMFRSLFNQTYEDAVKRYNQNITVKIDMQNEYQVSMLSAKSMFLIDPDEIYSLNEIKKQRNRLLKTFHPDNCDGEDTSKYTQKINNAYNFLKNNI